MCISLSEGDRGWLGERRPNFGDEQNETRRYMTRISVGGVGVQSQTPAASARIVDTIQYCTLCIASLR
jgi:hypothetical protein